MAQILSFSYTSADFPTPLLPRTTILKSDEVKAVIDMTSQDPSKKTLNFQNKFLYSKIGKTLFISRKGIKGPIEFLHRFVLQCR